MKSTFIFTTLIAIALGAPTTAPHGRQASGNFQTFTAALGGISATPVVDSGIFNRPFQVKGENFVNISAALARSCDQQFIACANAANSGDATLSVAACSTQKGQCSASVAASTAAVQGNAQAGGHANGNAQQNNNGNENGNGAACNAR